MMLVYETILKTILNMRTNYKYRPKTLAMFQECAISYYVILSLTFTRRKIKMTQ